MMRFRTIRSSILVVVSLVAASMVPAQVAPNPEAASTTDFTVSEATPTPTPVPAALVALRQRLDAKPASETRAPAIELFVNGAAVADKQTLLLAADETSALIEVRLGPALFTPQGRPSVGPAALGGRNLVVEHAVASRLEIRASSGAIITRAPGLVEWTPGGSEGIATITTTAFGQFTVRDEIETASGQESGIEEGETRTLGRSFSLVAPVPFDREGDGTLGATMIGIYPNERAADAPAVVARNPNSYAPPTGFYRLDGATAVIELAPGLTLGSLNPEPLPEADSMRFVAVSPRVAPYWTALRKEIDATGKQPGALRVLRGFVSPHERARLARLGVSLANFSRHQYGDAFVLIYDANGDGRLDDLNSDGQSTIADAEVLADWAERAMRASNLLGGLGVIAAYKSPTTQETPAVQIDVRGWFDRWKEE